MQPPRPAPRRYVFVLEQNLGHAVHGSNICRVLEGETTIDPTVIEIPSKLWRRSLPGTSNWSVEASLTTRSALLHRIRLGPVDAIFVHTQVAALAIKGIMRRIPTVVSLDATPRNIDSMAEAYDHHRHPAFIEDIKMRITRRALFNAAAVVAWSEWAATSVIKDYEMPAEKVMHIYPGVDLQRFKPTGNRRESHPVRVLFVGNDFERKGGPELLAAASALTSPSRAIELDLVTRDATVTIPPQVTARVHGGVEPGSAQMVELFRHADIFALPTKGEALGLVLMEAMASGLPVVSTRVGPIPDVIGDGRNGLLVDPGDVAGLALALERLVSESELRREMGRESRKLAEAEHDLQANTRRIFELMDEVSVTHDV